MTLTSSRAEIRRQAIVLRRYLAPQRDALVRLHLEQVKGFKQARRARTC